MPGFESRAVMPRPTLQPSPCYAMPPRVAWTDPPSVSRQFQVTLRAEKGTNEVSCMEEAVQGWRQRTPRTHRWKDVHQIWVRQPFPNRDVPAAVF